TLAFDPGDVPAAAPVLSWSLSLSQTNPVPVALVQASASSWTGDVGLAADAGATNELLQFNYQSVDLVNNLGHTILGRSAFQVYQGNLPTLNAPTGVSAMALSGGRIQLMWQPVEEAIDYAVYRQAPGEGGLTLLTTSTGQVALIDAAPDGTNGYAVASIRTANSQTSTGGQSAVVFAVADGNPPGMPTGLTLMLAGQGIFVSWVAPTNLDVVGYHLYRETAPIVSTLGLSPIVSNTTALTGLDPAPLPGGAYYAVTAIDDLDNESAPSTSIFTNISLLPVNSLSVTRLNDELPVVGWTHADPGNISGFNVYLNVTGALTRLTTPALPNATLTYTDTGFDGTNRLFDVAAEDQAGTNVFESARRSILLPNLSISLDEAEVIRRSVFNRLNLAVSNFSGLAVSNMEVEVVVNGVSHRSDPFDLSANAHTGVPVAVGGVAAWPDVVSLTNRIVIQPGEGDEVVIARTGSVAVADDRYVVDLLNDEMLRGANVKTKFRLHNTSDERVELVVARDGRPSPEIRFKLMDTDGSVYSVVPYTHLIGAQLITFFDGTTIARIEPGQSYDAAEVDLFVPASAPVELVLALEVDQFYHNYSQPNETSIEGSDFQKSLTLGNFVMVAGPAPVADDPGVAAVQRQITAVEISYTAEATNATPPVSFGDSNLTISGRAYDLNSGLPMPRVPIKLVVAFSGYERFFHLLTDDNGNWQHSYTPSTFEGGFYSAYAIHPLAEDRRDQVQFEIRRTFFGPRQARLEVPYDYPQEIDISVQSLGMTLTNAQLVYQAADQPGAVFPAGITISSNATVATIADGEIKTVMATINGATNAPASGTLYLRVVSAGPAPGDWGLVRVDYTFVQPPPDSPVLPTPAFPILAWSPLFIETGVAISNRLTEEVELRNAGYAELENISLSMV
ncbi:MAG: hypothetical protein AAF492_07325, partial [Verrucomicrobiota bacterium]